MSLTISGLGVKYGAITALEPLDLEVPTGGIVGVLGPNGAGKSSLIRALVGLVRSSGTVVLDGTDITRRTTGQRARLGIGYVPDSMGAFADLTVRENIQVAAGSEWKATWERLADAFPLLAAKADTHASSLSGGQRQTLSIARALATGPKYVLLDEPSMGLSPVAIKEVIIAIERLSSFGLGVIIAEQNVNLALDVSSVCHVLQRGRIALTGEPHELRSAPEIKRLYLGRAGNEGSSKS